ncbi:hypothetical protein ONZ43_g6944 [Nemania bipapillata]|uniref:Uncharacterized protein n=1 Tax=Nemania bipapillata TaxID=110536 RepID=A0ACC2HUN0_9PEZI|nr:hypothetical protein ONZ43_g6944 [Nemania bipapillata]
MRRDETSFPSYTLNILGLRVYIVNSLEVLQRVDRLAVLVCSVSQAGISKIYGNNLLAHDGYLYSHQRASTQTGTPGASLNSLSRSASAEFAPAFDRTESRGRTTVDIYDFVRQATFDATTDAMYGPNNPFRAEENPKDWASFEAGLPLFFVGLFPNILARRACKTRERLVTTFVDYFGKNKHLRGGSLFVELTQKVNDNAGFTLEDKARIEIG